MGTSDFSVLNINQGVFKVKASTGNSHLGGEDFDTKIMEYCIKEFKIQYRIDEFKDLSAMSMQKLKKSCENAKKTLSNMTKTYVMVNSFYDNKDIRIRLTRDKFEEICNDLFILCMKYVDDAVRISNLDRSQINEVILVGGCTRIPRIQQNLESFFGKKPNTSVNPDEAVSAGAAIQGYLLSHHNDDPFSCNVVLLDIIPLSLGIEVMREQMAKIINRNAIIPTKKTKRFTTDTDNESSISINIYEGERKLTRDNYKIGSFELGGIEPAPRGIPIIDVTISVDFNGVIEVTAIDQRNEETKKTLRITDDKGRLTNDQIERMVKEAKDSETEDRISGEKRRLRYEIKDMCLIVLENVDNKDYNIRDHDKEAVKKDINGVLDWWNNTANEVTAEEYRNIHEKIRKNYSTLILRPKKSFDNVKMTIVDTCNTSTTVYNDQEDENTLYEKLQNEDILEGLTDAQKQEVRSLRESLIELCYSITKLVQTNSIKLNDTDKKEIISSVDDVLMWVHVIERATPEEYISKMEEVNKICNEITTKYDEVFSKDDETTKIKNDSKTELENLCFALKCSIENHYFPIGENAQKTLVFAIDETLEWLDETKDVENEMVQKRKAVLIDLSEAVFKKIKNYNIKSDGIIVKQTEQTESTTTSTESISADNTENKIIEINSNNSLDASTSIIIAPSG